MSVRPETPNIAAELLCRLCALPVRAAIYDSNHDGREAFCCAGCRNVWRILIESGQLAGASDPRDTPLYRQALEAGLIGGQAAVPSSPHSASDSEVTQERKGSTLNDKRQCVLQINGMWCSSCAWLISQTLERQRGVVSAEVSFASDTARVIYKPAKTDETVLTKTVQELGYTASPLGESNDSDPRVVLRRREFLRVVICFAFAMNVMMMQLILYAGYFEGITRDIRAGLPWLLLVLSIPVVVTAYPIFYRAVQAARQGAATMETLIALGATAALTYSVWQTVVGTGHVYYDTADMLLGLVMVGKHIESGARQNASDALSLLYGLLPRKAVVLRDGRELPVAISQLADGDRVIVKAGERIAADGTVEDGAATVDESLLSGESRPVNKRSGDQAIGGTMLMNGFLTFRVDRTGEAGTLSMIIKHVEDALRRKTAVEKVADRISRVFVPLVLFLAAVSGVWLVLIAHAGAGQVLARVVAVLVIACPCALGIATPMAISAGVASAARKGMLVSDGGAFEILRKVKHIVLDKTGTVTKATFVVRRALGDADNIGLLTALEHRSGHPIAAAIIGQYISDSTEQRAVTDFAINEGVGVSGIVDGVSVFAGNEKAPGLASAALGAVQRQFAEECAADGLTVIFWGISGARVAGVIALGDEVRSGAADAIIALTSQGISTELLSGDSEAATSYVARQLNITKYQGGVSPTEKAAFVDSLKGSEEKVCMVGDGINDAPALAQADIGVALASGTDIAARTAQVTLLAPDLNLLPQLIKLSRRTVSIMQFNLFWAFLYNTVCIPLAMLGYVTPLWAVVAMILSSLTVILNTQRLGRD